MDADRLAALLSGWSGRAGGNLITRLTVSIRHLIESGVIDSGTRLPPERTLADALFVSRPTVGTSYRELRALGLVEARQGSGTWVIQRHAPAPTAVRFADGVLSDSGINLAAALPHDVGHLGRLLVDTDSLLSIDRSHGLVPRGLMPLRRRLADELGTWGVEAAADDMVMTSGAHHALSMALSALVGAGDRVIVEEHTYGGIVDLLEGRRAVPVPVRRDEKGVDPRALSSAIAATRPGAVYLIPSIHAPTGSRSDPDRLVHLARVLDEAGVPTIVDETYTHLDYGGRPTSLTSFLEATPAITIGSLSKVMWSGLRLGWLHARGEMSESIDRARSHIDLGAAVPSQLLALQVFDRFDAYIEERRGVLAERAALVASSFAASLPAFEVAAPDGGLTTWIRAPGDGADYAGAATRHGVTVLAGSMTRADRGPDDHIRLCHDRPAWLLEEAMARLAAAWSRPSL